MCSSDLTMADALAVWELPALAVPAYAVADAEMFEPSSPDVTVCEAGQLAVAPGASGSGLQAPVDTALGYVGVMLVRVTLPTFFTLSEKGMTSPTVVYWSLVDVISNEMAGVPVV